jgi:hypothetical protein
MPAEWAWAGPMGMVWRRDAWAGGGVPLRLCANPAQNTGEKETGLKCSRVAGGRLNVTPTRSPMRPAGPPILSGDPPR